VRDQPSELCFAEGGAGISEFLAVEFDPNLVRHSEARITPVVAFAQGDEVRTMSSV
jgi:hypothetical protein